MVMIARWGRTQFALVASLLWALPLAAWAGSVDLDPRPLTWVAFWIGLTMLPVWLGLIVWAARVPVPERPRRLELGQMGTAERWWMAGFALCLIGMVGWLNAAATVDLGGLVAALRQPRMGTMLLAGAIVALAAALTAGAGGCWRRASAHYRSRQGNPER